VAEVDPFRAVLAELSRFYVRGSSMEDTLHKVTDLAVGSIPGADLAGITVMRNGRPETAVFTDETAPEVDSAQYETGEGPCVYAFRFNEIYRIESMATEDRWPEFVGACRAHGIDSTLSMPLGIEGEAAFGALNFYSRGTASFPADGDELPRTFAQSAAAVLANTHAYWEAFTLSENLNEAMQSRAIIEQAKGVLMAQSGFDAERAFEVLNRASQRENRKVRDIAREIGERARIARQGES